MMRLALSRVAFAGLFFIAQLAFGQDLSSNNYYSVLGLPAFALPRQIRASFRNLSLTFHPDVNPKDPDAHEKITKLQRAASVLLDPQTRQHYDKTGKADLKKLTERGLLDSRVHPRSYYEGYAIFDGDDNIEILDFHSWTGALVNTDGWLINLYSSAQPYNERFSTEWTRVAARLTDSLHVAAVDCHDKASFPICHNLQIRSLPNVVMYAFGAYNGQQTPYVFQNEQTAERMVEFALFYQTMLVQALDASHFPRTKHQFVPFDGERGSMYLLGFCRAAGQTRCGSLALVLKEVSLTLKNLLPTAQVECGLAVNDALCHDFSVTPELPPAAGVDATTLPDTSAEDSILLLVSIDKPMPIPVHFPIDHRSLSRELLPHITLETITLNALEDLGAVVLAARPPDSKKKVTDVAWTRSGNGHSYLIMFYSSSLCPPTPPPGENNALTVCERAMIAMRQVAMTLTFDPNYKSQPLHPVTFDCNMDGDRAGASAMCTALGLHQETTRDGRPYVPELIMLADKALNPVHFHGDASRTDQINFFIQESYNSSIHVLSDGDFHLATEGKDIWYVDFYTPWCQDCRRVFPAFSEVSRRPEAQGVMFGKVNCEVYADLCAENKIQNYPTILLFINGTRHQFDYDFMTADEFVRFLKDAQQPPLRDLTMEQFKNEVWDPENPSKQTELNAEHARHAYPGGHDETDSWVINFFAPWCNHCHTMAPLFDAAAKTMKGVMTFGKFNCELEKDFCRQLGIRQFPTILRYHAASSSGKAVETQEFEGYNAPSSKSVLKFAVKHITDRVTQLTSTLYKDIVKSPADQSWFISFVSDKCDGCEELEFQMKALAARYHSREQARIKALAANPNPNPNDPYRNVPPLRVRFAQFNCKNSGTDFTLCMKLKLKVFPTFLWVSSVSDFKETYFTDYSGAQSLLDFVEGQLTEDRKAYLDPLRVAEPLRKSTEFEPNWQNAWHFFDLPEEKRDL